ncbi:MAG: hypothetical protein KGI54_14710 [Pseudomonadota bacterium]|nr:hypothetical protein [Pseudomonadota bacterium]
MSNKDIISILLACYIPIVIAFTFRVTVNNHLNQDALKLDHQVGIHQIQTSF